MAAKFTVMLCVHRPPAMLPFAMRSVLAQHHENLELFVVGDGAPPGTIACAKDFAARDPRVRVFDFPKGERHGEAHRHVALAEASGEFVAHIADDDLWFPSYLTELSALLEQVEFGNLILTAARPDGSFGFHFGDLADPKTREWLLTERWNFFGLTVTGYRLSTYRRLPEGWSPAPPDIWSDLNMWRKFLRLDGISAATRFAVESITIPAANREEVAMEQRGAENERWSRIVSDATALSDLRERIAQALAKHHAETGQRLLMRENEVQELVRRTTELKEHLHKRAGLVEHRKEEIRTRDAAILRSKDSIVRRDAAIARLKDSIEQRDAAILRLKDNVVRRDAAIVRMKDKLERKDAAIARHVSKAERQPKP